MRWSAASVIVREYDTEQQHTPEDHRMDIASIGIALWRSIPPNPAGSCHAPVRRVRHQSCGSRALRIGKRLRHLRRRFDSLRMHESCMDSNNPPSSGKGCGLPILTTTLEVRSPSKKSCRSATSSPMLSRFMVHSDEWIKGDFPIVISELHRYDMPVLRSNTKLIEPSER